MRVRVVEDGKVCLPRKEKLKIGIVRLLHKNCTRTSYDFAPRRIRQAHSDVRVRGKSQSRGRADEKKRADKSSRKSAPILSANRARSTIMKRKSIWEDQNVS